MTNPTETSAISSSQSPITPSELLSQLKEIGVRQGDLLLVHASLSRLGWVVGGVQTVLGALLDAIGDTGTLVMPGFSSQLSDPTHWERPPVPSEWHATIIKNMPLFDPERTPTRGMSKLCDALRALRDTNRSNHPIDSFLARGPLARDITKDHPLSPTFGQNGPLGKLNGLNAKVLFLGSGFDTCTSFHLAEYANPNAARKPFQYPTSIEDGETKWTWVEELDFQEGVFAQIGEDFERETDAVRNLGPLRLFPMQDAVNFAKDWFAKRT